MRRTVRALVPLLSLLAACASGNNPERASSQLQFGVKAARMNLWREARFRFERASQFDPRSATVKNDLAVAYEGSGDFEKARQTYAEALQLDPANTYIQKNYSRFMEFYTRNKRRQGGLPDKTPAKKPAPATAPAPSPLPDAASPMAPPPPSPDSPPPGDMQPPHGSAR